MGRRLRIGHVLGVEVAVEWSCASGLLASLVLHEVAHGLAARGRLVGLLDRTEVERWIAAFAASPGPMNLEERR